MIAGNLILIISCEDKPGILAAITEIILQQGGNITKLEQHVDPEDLRFFLRINLTTIAMSTNTWHTAFKPIIEKFDMQFDIFVEQKKTKLALLVSKEPHCLYDILAQHQSNRLNAEIAFVASNHDSLRQTVEQFGYTFYHCPINNNKAKQEQQLLQLMQQHQVESIILARYMQILSNEFINYYPNKIINIHHSFLPSFSGAKPYHQAWNKGVKMIGATSHFVTAELDEGPIISQSVISISHEDSVKDLVNLGKVVEQQTLTKALQLYVNHKVICHKNKTVVFK